VVEQWLPRDMCDAVHHLFPSLAKMNDTLFHLILMVDVSWVYSYNFIRRETLEDSFMRSVHVIDTVKW
jgi:hypothetical protein